MENFLLTKIKKEITQRKTDVQNVIFGGTLTYEDYKKSCGILQGITEVLELVEECFDKEFNDEQNDEDLE